MSPEQKLEFKRKAILNSKKWRKSKDKFYSYDIALETKNKRGTCPDQLLEKIRECARNIKRIPSKNNFIDYCGTQKFLHIIYATFGSWLKGREMALKNYKNKLPSIKGGRRKTYSKEELIEYLQIFYQENNKIPTETDCGRGLIPNSNTYRYHFGGLPQARKEAGILEIPNKWTNKNANN